MHAVKIFFWDNLENKIFQEWKVCSLRRLNVLYLFKSQPSRLRKIFFGENCTLINESHHGGITAVQRAVIDLCKVIFSSTNRIAFELKCSK